MNIHPEPPPTHLVPGEPIRVADLVKKVTADLSEAEARTYGSYLPLLVNGWTSPATGEHFAGVGDQWAHEVLPSALTRVVAGVQQRAQLTAAERDAAREEAGRALRKSKGDSAAYNAVGAIRRVFKVAVQERHVTWAFEPSREVDKKERPLAPRRPLVKTELEEMWSIVLNGGDDPELDAMMLNFILITGARRSGVISLDVSDISEATCMVWLQEKDAPRTEQPIPDWYARQLLAFAASRGSTRPGDPVFRYKPGRRSGGRHAGELTRISGRRFDTVFGRIQASAAWADQLGLCAHVLRHHAYALVERSFGHHIAEAFARHSSKDVTSLYGRASKAEVAKAVILMRGGTHPLVNQQAAAS